MGELINGKAVSKQVLSDVKTRVQRLQQAGITPGLGIIKVGNNPASEVYVRTKIRRAKKQGIDARLYELGENATQDDVMGLVKQLNDDPATHGFIVQLPLPDHLSADPVLSAVSPDKDVDGFHPYNLGMLVTGKSGFVPATALGVLSLIDFTGVNL